MTRRNQRFPTLTCLLLALPALAESPGTDSEDKAVRLAIEVLAESRDVAPDRIVMRKIKPVDWSDTALGCPEKGMSYAQVITPGYLIHLSAEGSVYPVHVGGNRAIICERNRRGIERASKEIPPEIVRLVDEAREDLAARLEVPESGIRLAAFRKAQWTAPEQACLAVEASSDQPVEGVVLELFAGERSFHYESDGQNVVLCEDREELDDAPERESPVDPR